jgi:lipoprotein signal peptidase
MTDPQDGSPEAPALPPEPTLPSAAPAPVPAPTQTPPPARPTFVFFGAIAAVSLLADVTTKAWAEITLSRRDPLEPSIELIKEHLAFTLAYNPGGAWGLFQRHSEYIRRPFFLLVSLLAIAFIINLYGRLTPGQRALKWGLPLVLGGALGNLSDRIVRSNVIDFIDYQARWIEAMNRLISKAVPGWAITDHWPTFNVADIAICVGVGLMAVDMFTSRRGPPASLRPPALVAGAPGLTGLAPVPGPQPVEPDLGSLEVPDARDPLKPEA